MTDSTRSKGRGHGGPAKGAGRGGPARGYTRPPAGEGNVLALVHGAGSRRVLDPVAAELVAEVVADQTTGRLFPRGKSGLGRRTGALRGLSLGTTDPG